MYIHCILQFAQSLPQKSKTLEGSNPKNLINILPKIDYKFLGPIFCLRFLTFEAKIVQNAVYISQDHAAVPQYNMYTWLACLYACQACLYICQACQAHLYVQYPYLHVMTAYTHLYCALPLNMRF